MTNDENTAVIEATRNHELYRARVTLKSECLCGQSGRRFSFFLKGIYNEQFIAMILAARK